MSISDQRLALFALISEFEIDVREIIANFVCSDHTLLGDIGAEAFTQLLHRAKTDANSEMFDERTLLPFLDIGESIKLLISNKSLMPPELRASLRA